MLSTLGTRQVFLFVWGVSEVGRTDLLSLDFDFRMNWLAQKAF